MGYYLMLLWYGCDEILLSQLTPEMKESVDVDLHWLNEGLKYSAVKDNVIEINTVDFW